MEYSKVLENKNRITSTTLYQKAHTETSSNFSIRFVFGGNEICTIGRRQLSIHSDSFIILNKGTQFTSNIDPHWPVTIFSIELDANFLNEFISKNFKGDKTGLFDHDISVQQLRETIYPFRGELKSEIYKLKSYLDKGLDDDGSDRDRSLGSGGRGD